MMINKIKLLNRLDAAIERNQDYPDVQGRLREKRRWVEDDNAFVRDVTEKLISGFGREIGYLVRAHWGGKRPIVHRGGR